MHPYDLQLLSRSLSILLTTYSSRYWNMSKRLEIEVRFPAMISTPRIWLRLSWTTSEDSTSITVWQLCISSSLLNGCRTIPKQTYYHLNTFLKLVSKKTHSNVSNMYKCNYVILNVYVKIKSMDWMILYKSACLYVYVKKIKWKKNIYFVRECKAKVFCEY